MKILNLDKLVLKVDGFTKQRLQGCSLKTKMKNVWDDKDSIRTLDVQYKGII